MMRKTKKQLGKTLADKFENYAEYSSRVIVNAIAEGNVNVGTIEEFDRMRGYITAMEEIADMLGSSYLYKKLLIYKSQFEVYFNKLSELYVMKKINFYPGERKENNFSAVEQQVKEQVQANGR